MGQLESLVQSNSREFEITRTLPMQLVVNNVDVYNRLTRGVDAVAFDLESTLGVEESADFIFASRLDIFNECEGQLQHRQDFNKIKELTNRGMNGDISVEESMRERWGLIRPSLTEFVQAAHAQAGRHTPHARETVNALQKMNKQVFLITGGFSPYANIVADQLGIEPDNIICNTMNFNEHEEFHSIEGPVMNGKSDSCKKLIEEHGIDPERFVLIGDGMNDLDVYESGIAPVVGFGGIRPNDNLAERFPVYLQPREGRQPGVLGRGSIAPVLSVICTPRERADLPEDFVQHTAIAA